MGTTAHTPYDDVFYPGHPFGQTHPERLATVASLFGVRPTPITRCRVLELGCGTGGNLIPMAYQLPDSEFVGIDLSESAIAQGNSNLARLGLSNLTLRHGDIMDIAAADGRFDYIMAHGVLSWVPPPVRSKIFGILHENLTPHGVGYVSYNAFPASHFRDMTREMMLYHVKHMDDSKERVAQARALLKMLAETTAENSVYGVVLRDQFDRVRKMPDEVLYHDDLSPSAQPFFLHEVAAAAKNAGLQYLGEATFAHTSFGGHGDKIAAVLQQIPAEAFIEREQYLDFLVGRGFRETLFCQGDVALRRDITHDCVRNYHIAAAIDVGDAADPATPGVAVFTTGRTSKISTDHALSKAALIEIGLAWPRAFGFAELVERGLARLGAAAAEVRADLAEHEDALATMLFRAFCYDHIYLHLFPPEMVTAMSARPQASLLARREAEAGHLVTTLRHGLVALEDPVVRRFLGLVDGSRTVEQLVSDLRAALGREPGAADAEARVTADTVRQNLRILARLGLLVA